MKNTSNPPIRQDPNTVPWRSEVRVQQCPLEIRCQRLLPRTESRLHPLAPWVGWLLYVLVTPSERSSTVSPGDQCQISTGVSVRLKTGVDSVPRSAVQQCPLERRAHEFNSVPWSAGSSSTQKGSSAKNASRGGNQNSCLDKPECLIGPSPASLTGR